MVTMQSQVLHPGLFHDRLVVQSHEWQTEYPSFSEVPGWGRGRGPGEPSEEMLQGSKRTFGTSLPTCHHSSGFYLFLGLIPLPFQA